MMCVWVVVFAVLSSFEFYAICFIYVSGTKMKIKKKYTKITLMLTGRLNILFDKIYLP